MEKMLKYSILRYIPSRISGEVINLGILLCDEDRGIVEFKYTKNVGRVLNFDDSLSKKTLLLLLNGIQKEIEKRFINTKFDIYDYVKYYINEFCFDKPILLKYDSFEVIKEELYKSYFRFDFEKKSRPSVLDDKKMLSRILKSNGLDFSSDKKVIGSFEEEIAYDIITHDYYIKIFDFDGKDLKRIINTAKMWSWNCNHADKKVIIMYRYSENELSRANFEIIKNIFNESKGYFCNVEDGIKLLKNAV